MLENEIIPLYFAKNSKGYSPEWIQYIKNSIAFIAPNYTMSRMMHDYFERFYNPQAARSKKLKASNYKLAREIVAWKENVVQHWDGVKLVDEIHIEGDRSITGAAPAEVTLKIDTATLGRSIAVELVVYKEADGETRFHKAYPLEVVAEDGDILTYHLKHDIKYSGVFKYAFRVYPWNKNLPHRQDFAYLKWF